jgi:hypothetical protein
MKTNYSTFHCLFFNTHFLNRDTDDDAKIKNLESMGRQYSCLPCKTRKVNFVIFVVDGISILRSIDSNKKEYMDMLCQTFMNPFLSFGGMSSYDDYNLI